MYRYILALLTLLVTGYLSVTCDVSVYLLLPFLFPSSLVFIGHTYVYCDDFIRRVVSIHDCYETVNYYHPGCQSYSDQYALALCQIAVELARHKINTLFESFLQGPNQENTVNAISSNTYSSGWLSMNPGHATIYIVAALCFFLYLVLRLAICLLSYFTTWLAGLFLSLITAFNTTSLMIYCGVILILAWSLDVIPGTNTGILDLVFQTHLYMHKQFPESKRRLDRWRPVIIEVACCVCIAPHFLLLGMQAGVAWLAGRAIFICYDCNSLVVSFSVSFAYMFGWGLLKSVVSIIRSTWAWVPRYREAQVRQYENPKEAEINKVLEERHKRVLENAQVHQFKPEESLSSTQFPTFRYQSSGFGVNPSSKRHTLFWKLGYARARLQLGLSDNTGSSPATKNESALLSVPSPDIFRLPPLPLPTSSGSAPDLSYNGATSDESLEVAIPAPIAHPALPVVPYSQPPPRQPSLLRVAGSDTRERVKSRPLLAPKELQPAYTTSGEGRLAAWISRSDWKQRTKLGKQKRQAKTVQDIHTSLETGSVNMEIAVQSQVGLMVPTPLVDPSKQPAAPGPAKVALRTTQHVEPQATPGPAHPSRVEPAQKHRSLLGLKTWLPFGEVGKPEKVNIRKVKGLSQRRMAPVPGRAIKIQPATPTPTPAPSNASPDPNSTLVPTPPAFNPPVASSSASSSSARKRSQDDSTDRPAKRYKAHSTSIDDKPVSAAPLETLSQMLRSGSHRLEQVALDKPSASKIDLAKSLASSAPSKARATPYSRPTGRRG